MELGRHYLRCYSLASLRFLYAFLHLMQISWVLVLQRIEFKWFAGSNLCRRRLHQMSSVSRPKAASLASSLLSSLVSLVCYLSKVYIIRSVQISQSVTLKPHPATILRNYNCTPNCNIQPKKHAGKATMPSSFVT